MWEVKVFTVIVSSHVMSFFSICKINKKYVQNSTDSMTLGFTIIPQKTKQESACKLSKVQHVLPLMLGFQSRNVGNVGRTYLR